MNRKCPANRTPPTSARKSRSARLKSRPAAVPVARLELGQLLDTMCDNLELTDFSLERWTAIVTYKYDRSAATPLSAKFCSLHGKGLSSALAGKLPSRAEVLKACELLEDTIYEPEPES